MELKDLAKRLRNISDEKKLVKILEFPLQDLFFRILYDMAKAQAPDTSQARMNIIRRCADKLGSTYSEMADKLIQSYEYWWKHGYPENIDRSPENIAESKVVMSNGIFQWSSTDMAILKQEDGRKISTAVEDKNGNKRDNTGLFVNHITTVSKQYNDGYNIDIIDKHIENYIKSYIETGVMK